MPQMSKLLLGSAAVSAGTWAFLAPTTGQRATSAQLRGAQAQRTGSPSSSYGMSAAAVVGAACGMASIRRAGKQQRKAEDDAYGASHTSFYTDAVAKDKYDTLEEAGLEEQGEVLWQTEVTNLTGNSLCPFIRLKVRPKKRCCGFIPSPGRF